MREGWIGKEVIKEGGREEEGHVAEGKREKGRVGDGRE